MKITANRRQIFWFALIWGLLFPLFHKLNYLAKANFTTGKVEYMQPIKGKKGDGYYRAIVRFSIKNKDIKTGCSRLHYFKFYEPGESVKILYNNDLTEIYIFTFTGFWWLNQAGVTVFLLYVFVLFSGVYSFIPPFRRYELRIGKKRIQDEDA